jgi:hypothetical protein
MPIGRLQTEGELEAFIRDAIDRHDSGVLLRSAQARADALEARLPGPLRARVRNSAALAINNNSTTVMTFDTERWDEGGFFAPGTPGRLTAPEAGHYLIGSHAAFAANATGTRELLIRLNGGSSLAIAPGTGSASREGRMSVVTEYELAAGDYIESLVFQDSGGVLNVVATSAYSPEFWIVRLPD